MTIIFKALRPGAALHVADAERSTERAVLSLCGRPFTGDVYIATAPGAQPTCGDCERRLARRATVLRLVRRAS